MEVLSNLQRSEILSSTIARYIKQGYKLQDKNETAFTATMYREAEKTNHILHLLLTLVTCFLWVLIWGGKAAFKKGAHSVYIKVDEYGNVRNA